MEVEDVRRFALSLPETTESPHFESASFRIRGRIFATLPPDGEHLHVFVDEDETRAVAAGEGPAYEELWWGKRLAGARVHLPSLESPHLVRELVEDAWRRKAPKKVVAAFDAAADDHDDADDHDAGADHDADDHDAGADAERA